MNIENKSEHKFILGGVYVFDYCFKTISDTRSCHLKMVLVKKSSSSLTFVCWLKGTKTFIVLPREKCMELSFVQNTNLSRHSKDHLLRKQSEC